MFTKLFPGYWPCTILVKIGPENTWMVRYRSVTRGVQICGRLLLVSASRGVFLQKYAVWIVFWNTVFLGIISLKLFFLLWEEEEEEEGNFCIFKILVDQIFEYTLMVILSPFSIKTRTKMKVLKFVYRFWKRLKLVNTTWSPG